jgi:hypothetical protein
MIRSGKDNGPFRLPESGGFLGVLVIPDTSGYPGYPLQPTEFSETPAEIGSRCHTWPASACFGLLRPASCPRLIQTQIPGLIQNRGKLTLETPGFRGPI